MSLETGAKLGAFEIPSQRGPGDMGEVDRAKDTRLDRTGAFELSRSELVDRDELEERVEQEARVP